MKAQKKHEFQKVHEQMKSLYDEISLLARKSNKDGINKFKLKFVNNILGRSNEILGEKYRPFQDFTQFDEVELPTNSDVTMILGQYLSCLEKYRYDQAKSTGDIDFDDF